MKHAFKHVGVGALVALTLFVSAPTRAQSVDNRILLDRINQLEGQVQDLSRKSYGRGYVPGDVITSSSSGGTVSPNVESRLQALEAQIRDLTGQVERANFNAQQASANLDKFKNDAEGRLQKLEEMRGNISAQSKSDAVAPVTNGDQAANGDNADVIEAEAAVNATPEELYNRAYAAMQKKEYETAEKNFRDFLAKNPSSKLAANAQYWLGETYFARGNYKAASAVFAESYQKYPKSIKAPDSLLKLGLSLSQQNRTKDACTVLNQLAKEYPSTSGTIATRTEVELKKLKCS